MMAERYGFSGGRLFETGRRFSVVRWGKPGSQRVKRDRCRREDSEGGL